MRGSCLVINLDPKIYTKITHKALTGKTCVRLFWKKHGWADHYWDVVRDIGLEKRGICLEASFAIIKRVFWIHTPVGCDGFLV